LLLNTHLYDRQMGHVRPLFRAAEHGCIQSVVKFAQAVGSIGNPDEDRGGYRNERFYVAQGYFERLDATADFFQNFARSRFRALQSTRGENREMGRQMREFRMKFPAQLFDKLTDRVSNVSDQGVAEGVRHQHAI